MDDAPSLDQTAVREQHDCLKPVVDEFVKWYNKHSHKMCEVERVECQWSLDNLTAARSPLFIPHNNKVYRRYLGTGSYDRTARDLTWATFYLLRLFYVDCYKTVVAIMSLDHTSPVQLPDTVRTTSQRFLESSMGTFIKERYGNEINLEKEEYPGPAPPRPASWPALGLRLVPANTIKELRWYRTPKRKLDASVGENESLVFEDDHSDEEPSAPQADTDEAFNPSSVSLSDESEHPRRSKRARLSPVEGVGMDLGHLLDTQSSHENNTSSPERQEESTGLEDVTSPQEPPVPVDDNGSAAISTQGAVDREVVILSTRQDALAVLERERLNGPPSLAVTDEQQDREMIHQHLSNVRREIINIHERHELAEAHNRVAYKAVMDYLKTTTSQPQSNNPTEALRAQVRDQETKIQQQHDTINELKQENQKRKEEIKALTSRLEKFFPVFKTGGGSC